MHGKPIKTYQKEQEPQDKPLKNIGDLLKKIEEDPMINKGLLDLITDEDRQKMITKENIDKIKIDLMTNKYAISSEGSVYQILKEIDSQIITNKQTKFIISELIDVVDGIVSEKTQNILKKHYIEEITEDVENKIKKEIIEDTGDIKKDIERTNHDIGAIEYYLNELKIEKDPSKEYERKKILDIKNRIYAKIIEGNEEDKKYILDDVARELMKLYYFKNIYMGKEDTELNIYQKGIWVPRAFATIDAMCKKIFRKKYSKRTTRGIIGHIESSTYVDECDFEEKQPELICLENGVFDVFKRELKPFSPKHYFRTKIPIKYDPNANSQDIQSAFRTYLPEEDQFNTLQEMFGYCLYRKNIFHKIFLLTGEGGNGKGTTLEILRRLLGFENVSSESMEVLCNLRSGEGRFATSNLYGKSSNIVTETFSGQLKDTSVMKAVSSGDIIKADRKGMQSISFEPYCKLVFAANDIPICRDKGYAMKRRWCVLNFEQRFTKDREKEEIIEKMKEENEDYVDEERRIHKEINDFANKICTSENLSSLFNWALDGLDRLMKNQRFSDLKSLSETQRILDIRSNPFSVFLSDMIEEATDIEFISKKCLKEEYQKWCRRNSVRKNTNDSEIKQELYDRFESLYEKQTSDFGERERVWGGIRFRRLDSSVISENLSTKSSDCDKNDVIEVPINPISPKDYK